MEKKKIVLYGDSIRVGYDKYVKEALENVANVYYPLENCKFAVNVLRFAHEWKELGEWPDDIDLVHWNAGLWDALELFGDEPLTPLEVYKDYIFRVYKRLRFIYPKAKLVFATSTAVIEEKCSPDFRRHNSIIEEYNRVAVEVLSKTDSVINDLFSITKNCPEEYHSDCVHYYTDSGREMIGGKVLSVICKELDIKAKDVNIKDFKPDFYSKKEIGY